MLCPADEVGLLWPFLLHQTGDQGDPFFTLLQPDRALVPKHHSQEAAHQTTSGLSESCSVVSCCCIEVVRQTEQGTDPMVREGLIVDMPTHRVWRENPWEGKWVGNCGWAPTQDHFAEIEWLSWHMWRVSRTRKLYLERTIWEKNGLRCWIGLLYQPFALFCMFSV